MNLISLLSSVTKRYGTPLDVTGRGIGLALAYFKAAEEGLEGLSPWLIAGVSQRDWLKARKDAETKLVFRDDGMVITGGGWKSKDATEMKLFGAPVRKDASVLTPDSIMDFEGIATFKKKDRDGDVVEPIGAEFDPKQPLLLHHNATLPVGKMVATVQQDEQLVKNHWAMANTALANDNAPLVEFGSYRLSIGFQPVIFVAIDESSEDYDSDGKNGWHIQKCYVMETSLVTIPANTDAIITQFSRNKFATEYMKAWSKSFFDARPIIVKGGFNPATGSAAPPVHVTVNITNDSIKSSQTNPEAPKVENQFAVGDVVKVANDNSRFGKVAAVRSDGWVSVQPETKDAKAFWEHKDNLAKKDAADGDPKPGEKPDETKPQEKPKGDEPPPEEQKGENPAIADIENHLKELSTVNDMPQEAKDRLTCMTNMLASCKESHEATMGAIQEAAKSGDLGAIKDAMDTHNDSVVNGLARMSAEMGNVMGVPGLSDEHKSALAHAHDTINLVHQAYSAMKGDGAFDDSDQGMDDKADLSNDDHDGDDLDQHKDDDDDDRESKEDDDEDREEKLGPGDTGYEGGRRPNAGGGASGGGGVRGEGQAARAAGKPKTDNPYPAGSPSAMYWDSGWEAGGKADEPDADTESEPDEEKNDADGVVTSAPAYGDEIDADDDGVAGWEGKNAEELATKLIGQLMMGQSLSSEVTAALNGALDEQMQKNLDDALSEKVLYGIQNERGQWFGVNGKFGPIDRARVFSESECVVLPRKWGKPPSSFLNNLTMLWLKPK